MPAAAQPRQYTGYPVKLYCFSGPLDLLLHLVRSHELGIAEIPVAEITRQYLEYLRAMEAINVELSADFLVLAATLSYLKSRALLPPEPEEELEEELAAELDPAVRLQQRLAEYQVYRQAAERLDQSRQVRERVYLRPLEPDTGLEAGYVTLEDVSLFDMVRAVGELLKRAEPEPTGRVVLPTLTVPDRLEEVLLRLRTERRELTFSALVGERPTRTGIIVTFLALLELIRRHLVEVRQDGPLGEIFVQEAPPESSGFAAPDPAETAP